MAVSLGSFIQDYSKESFWVGNGWKVVPKIDGEGIESWEELIEDCEESLLDSSGKWFKTPVEVLKQKLVTVNQSFATLIRTCKTTDDIKNCKHAVDNTETSVTDMVSGEPETFVSPGWTFSVSNVSEHVLPPAFDLKSVTGFLERNRWFIEGHVNSPVSFSTVFCGRKIFLFAESGEATEWLLKTMQNVEAFMYVAMNGPPEKLRGKLSVCIPQSLGLRSLVIVPASTGRACLTVRGPCFEARWQLNTKSDDASCSSSDANKVQQIEENSSEKTEEKPSEKTEEKPSEKTEENGLKEPCCDDSKKEEEEKAQTDDNVKDVSTSEHLPDEVTNDSKNETSSIGEWSKIEVKKRKMMGRPPGELTKARKLEKKIAHREKLIQQLKDSKKNDEEDDGSSSTN